MKNVIVLLVDSFFSERSSVKRTVVSSTDFMDKLSKNGFIAENVYSFGPYTFAATKGLLNSKPTLNDFGYFYRNNFSGENHFDIFKENNYETFSFTPPTNISITSNNIVDNQYHISGFNYSAQWQSNLEYYSLKKNKKPLTHLEYKIIKLFLDLMFNAWVKFYIEIVTFQKSTSLIEKYIDYKCAQNVLDKILLHQKSLKLNEIEYIDSVLKLGLEHELATLDCVNLEMIGDKLFLKKVYERNEDTIKYIQDKTLKLNLSNNKIYFEDIKKVFKNLIINPQESLRFIYNYYCALTSQSKMIKDSLNGIWQEEPSARTLLRKGIEVLKKREQTDKPFYMFLHLLDAHERISYFSYDIEDFDLINKEFEQARKIADGCGEDFKGSLVYQMSLNYIDSCIEELYNSLDNMNLLDDTVIMIVGDHGSSYTYDPIRENVVNNFYKENYNVPLIIWQKDKKYHGINRNKFSSMDVFPTLYEILGIETPNTIKGESIFKQPNGRDIIITEYLGPGTADMLTREAWMSARNDKYMIAYKTRLDQKFDRENVFQLFDLENDVYEKRDIKSNADYNCIEIKELIDSLEKRFNEIIVDRDNFIHKIQNNELHI